jgi:hypothetical protein
VNHCARGVAAAPVVVVAAAVVVVVARFCRVVGGASEPLPDEHAARAVAAAITAAAMRGRAFGIPPVYSRPVPGWLQVR